MVTKLPKDYVEFISSTKTLWGETDYEFGSYFDLEPLEEIDKLNKDIDIETNAPGFVAFASDGGGEVFVFDGEGQIYLMPMIGMEPSAAIKIASSWQEFKAHIVQFA